MFSAGQQPDNIIEEQKRTRALLECAVFKVKPVPTGYERVWAVNSAGSDVYCDIPKRRECQGYYSVDAQGHCPVCLSGMSLF